jgi:glucose-1-phosphate thymidylyltransferase
LNGRVKIEEGARVVNSVIRGPCIIGRDCLIEDSFIGPYTSIGDNTKILNSNVEHCVILENSLIKDVDRLQDSLIGRNARVFKNQRNRGMKLHIGDFSEVEI